MSRFLCLFSSPLCYSPLEFISLFRMVCVCFLPVPLSPLFDVEARQQSIREFHLNLCLVVLLLTVCVCFSVLFFKTQCLPDFKIGRPVHDIEGCHIFPGRHWVSRFTTEPFTMKDRGIKAAAASDPTYCLENVKQYVFLTDISIILSQTPLPQKCTVAAFTTHALLFLSQPFFSSCRIQTLSLF